MSITSAVEPNVHRLADDLRDECFDADQMRETIKRVATIYGSEALKEVFDLALGTAACNAGRAEAEFEKLKAMLAEYGFSMSDCRMG